MWFFVFFFLGYVPQRIFLLATNRSASAQPKNNASTSSSTDNAGDEPVDIANPFERDQKQCILCKMNLHPNYKNVRLLSQFQSPYTGRIYGRHITGLCTEQQARVEREINRSQRAGHMPAYNKAVEFLQDPRLFDPERPVRPHNY